MSKWVQAKDIQTHEHMCAHACIRVCICVCVCARKINSDFFFAAFVFSQWPARRDKIKQQQQKQQQHASIASPLHKCSNNNNNNHKTQKNPKQKQNTARRSTETQKPQTVKIRCAHASSAIAAHFDSNYKCIRVHICVCVCDILFVCMYLFT